jgi:hypothetical protein
MPRDIGQKCLRNGAKGLEIDKEGLNMMLPGVQQRLRRYLCIAPGLVCLIALFAGCGTYTYGQGANLRLRLRPQLHLHSKCKIVVQWILLSMGNQRIGIRRGWLETASGKRFNIARPRHLFSRNIALTPEQTIRLLLKTITANARS